MPIKIYSSQLYFAHEFQKLNLTYFYPL